MNKTHGLSTLFGYRLKFLRAMSGMTQAELAGRIDLCVKQLGRIERGESAPSFAAIENLAQALQTSVFNLFFNILPERQANPSSQSESPEEACMPAGQRLCLAVRMAAWSLDGPGRKHIWSDSLYAMLGYAPHAVKPTPEHFLKHVRPSQQNAAAEFLAHVEGEIETTPLLLDITTRRGHDRKLKLHTEMFRAFPEHSPRPYVILQDITECLAVNQAVAWKLEQLGAYALRKNKDLADALDRCDVEARQRAHAEGGLHVFERMVNSSLDAQAFIDKQGIIVAVNAAYEKLMGIPSERIAGQKADSFLTEFWGREHFERIMKPRLEAALLHGKNASMQEWREYPHHGRRYVKIVYTPCQRNGNFTGIVATVHDLTDFMSTHERLERSERALLKSKDLLDTAGRIAKFGGWRVDLAEDRVRLSSQAAAIHDMPPGYCPTVEQALNFYPPEWRTKIADVFGKCTREGVSFDEEVEFVTRQGRRIWIRATGEAVRDEFGTITLAQGALQDITERKLAEQATRIKTQALDASLDAMLLADLDGHLIYVNPAYRSLWGYERDERILGRSMAELWADEQLVASILSTLREHGRTTGESKVKRRDGHSMSIHFSATLNQDDAGRPTSIVASFRDITKQLLVQRELIQAKQQAEAAVTAKSEFLANMSHEIRTPMNGVIGMTGLLLDTNLTPDQQRIAESIQASGETLLALLNDILDFSKIEAGRLDIEDLDFDLHHLLDDFSSMMAVQAHAKHLELTCHADPKVPHLLRGDPGRLRQILNNLTGNAVKFTDTGEVAVRVDVADIKDRTKAATNDVALLFTVRDTGIGVPEDKIDYIFDKFSQVDASATRRFGGTGLGLAISRQLAAMMGGEIGARSVPGRGSEFWFTARFAKQDVQPRAPVSTYSSINKTRILVVDDNATNRDILMRQLTAWNALPAQAEDGPTALGLLDEAHEAGEPFSLVIADMQMPRMDGMELAGAIKADPRHQSVPLVMLTSLGRPGDARRFAEAGFAAYLTKPVRQSELFDTLITVLRDPTASSPTRPIITRHLARERMRHDMSLPRFSGRVLVAEDNPVNQEVAVGLLRKLGLTADVARDGVQALGMLPKGCYDLVFMDIQMPEMDGYEATKEIRKKESELSSRNAEGVRLEPKETTGIPDPLASAPWPRPLQPIPIIAMTAAAMHRDRQRCFEAGMNDHLVKPVNLHDLRKVLQRWLPPRDPEACRDRDPSSQASSSSTHQDLPANEIFNEAELLHRLGDKELATMAARMFMDSLAESIAPLREDGRAENLQEIRKAAHTVKGAALNLSCSALAAAAQKVEMTAQNQDSNEVAALLPELNFRAEEVTKRLFEFCKQQGFSDAKQQCDT